MTIRKLQFDFPNHSNEKEKGGCPLQERSKPPREGFMVRGVVVFFYLSKQGLGGFCAG